MLWIRVRVVATAILAAGIASGGASVYVLGFQEPATTVQSPQTKSTKEATGQPEPAASRATLRAQQLATRKAKANYEIARSTRELAEIAVEEYQEVSYPHELATIEGEIKLAEAELTRSKDSGKLSEELNSQKAKFTLEQRQSKLHVLEQYTKSKTIKELKCEVEKSLSVELAKKEDWGLEKAKEAEMERQFRLGTH
jgi:hypothetical protein